MHLVAYRAFRAVRDAQRDLVFERVRVLITAEFAPCRVELARHAQKFKPEPVRVSRRHREMVVSPAARGQRLDFEVRVRERDVAPPRRDMAAVVKYPERRVYFMYGFVYLCVIFFVCPVAELFDRVEVARVFALGPEYFHAVLAVAYPRRDYIQKIPLDILEFSRDFPDLLEQNIKIRRVKAKYMPARAHKTAVPAAALVFVAQQPLGMLAVELPVEPRGDINRGLNADLVTCVYHFGQ